MRLSPLKKEIERQTERNEMNFQILFVLFYVCLSDPFDDPEALLAGGVDVVTIG